MIRREAGTHFLLIAQTDHAVLAGQLAAFFGGGRFTRPLPRETVLTAISQHDAGWPLHDDEPTLNDRHRPLDVFEVPRQIALRVWAESAERAAAIDPYAGLLASLHSLSLSIYATTQTQHAHEKFDISQMQTQFEVNKFQHREVERQEQLRRKLGFRTDVPLKHGLAEPGVTSQDDQIRFHFRLMQAMDLLSLCACCTHLPAEETNEVLASPNADPIKLKIYRDADDTLHVRPWPFDAKRIELNVPGKRVPARQYASVEEFRHIYKDASVDSLRVVLTP